MNAYVSRSIEACIFCGNEAIAESNLDALKQIIINVLRSEEMASANAQEISGVLKRLAAQEISTKQAEKELDEIAPGLGSRIVNMLKEHGLVAIPILFSALGMYQTYQISNIAREANEISRAALELSIEQAVDKSLSIDIPPVSITKKNIPAKPSMQKASPHDPMHKNRKMRLAEKAKKRKSK